MKKLNRFMRFSTLFLFALFAFSAHAAEVIEEVIVTGSYLKRSTADSPSPLSVIDREEIDAIGATEIKDVIANMTYQSGNFVASNVYNGGDSSNGQTNVNLRNLGLGSTLVLVNGKRTIADQNDNSGNGYVDLSQLVPNLALERVEVVKDGASALYGSDAIAGVVNFITRDNFEGVEIQVDYSEDDETNTQTDVLVSAIMGIAGDRGNAMISASHLDRDPLQYIDRLDYFGNSGLSTLGQPGRYVPLGAITPNPNPLNPAGSSTFGGGPDLDCNQAIDGSGQGTLGDISGFCLYDFSSFFPLVAELVQQKMFGTAEYELSDSIRVYGEFGFSFNEYQRQNSLFPDVTFAIIPADHPGLINDANRRGIQPVPYLALQRMLGGTINTPFEDRPIDTQTLTRRDSYRYLLGTEVDLDVGNGSWVLDVSLSQTRTRVNTRTRSDTVTSKTNLAYVGLGGPDCDPVNDTAGSGNFGTGSCYYYNPFGSSRFQPDGSPQTDPLLVNPDELLQWMAGEIASQYDAEQNVLDVVLTGDVMDMSAGPLQLALGYQKRVHDEIFDIDKVSNDNDFKFIFGAQDYSGKLTSTAFFSELAVPVSDNLDLQIAVRYEDFDEIGESTTDPKITALWRPTDDLSVRVSAGSSFRVGSPLQLFGSLTTLLNSTDPFSGAGGLAFRASITGGNPDLVPEEADMWNIGLSWAPSSGALEGLSVDIDYYNYEYDDLLTREAHQDLINKDNASRCPNGINTDPAAGPLCGASDQNGDGIDEVYSIGPGLPDKVIRGADGTFFRTEASYVNAQSLETSGVDLVASYSWSTDNLGDWRISTSVSYTIDYDLTDPDGLKIDGVGSRNAANTIGHSLPEYKANVGLYWNMDRHGALILARYIDEYEDDIPQDPLRGAFIGLHPTIDSMTTVDVQYTYNLPEMGFLLDGSQITLGIKNAANEEPPHMNTDGGFDPFTHNPIGRMWYGRFRMAL